MSDDMESTLRKCNSMEEIRKEVQNKPPLKEALQDSIEPVKLLLASIFQRLELKEVPFSMFCSATDHEVEGFFDILQNIQPNLVQQSCSNKKSLPKWPKLEQFINHCCYFRKYVFGVKKCGKPDCTICLPIRLPREVL